jgi:hypothetical protein
VFTTANALFMTTKRLVGLTETLQDCAESFTVSGSGLVASTNRLAVVANMTASSAPPNVDDAWRIVYLTGFPVFGETVYRLYPCDINERQQAINRLTMTTGRGLITERRNYVGNGSTNSLSDSKTLALADYRLSGSDYGMYNTTRYQPGSAPSTYSFTAKGSVATNGLVNIAVSSGLSNKTVAAVHYAKLIAAGDPSGGTQGGAFGVTNEYCSFNPWGKTKLADGSPFPHALTCALMKEDVVNFKFSSAWQVGETNKATISGAYIDPPTSNKYYCTGFYYYEGYNTYDHKTWMTYY